MALQLAKTESADCQRKPLSYEEIATSKTFRFTVGRAKREFTMPSALVAAQSPALERLVNGDFKEAQEGHADFETVEEETFLRFVQYVYTGNYREDKVDPVPEESDDSAGLVEEPSKKEEEYPEPEPEPEKADDMWGPWAVSSKKKKSKEKYANTSKAVVFQALVDKFTKKLSTLEEVKDGNSSPNIRLGGQPTSNPYLTHAMVFVFADYWGIDRLRDLSLRSLGKKLNDAAVKKRVTRDQVVALVEYCYEEARPEKLMGLVVLYAASKLPQLWLSARFQEIFGDNRELSVALVGAIVESGL